MNRFWKAFWKGFWEGFWKGSILGLALFLALSALAHCSVHGGTQNSIAEISDLNPYIYVVGTIQNGDVRADKNGNGATDIHIHPLYTPMLYEQYLSFCGDRRDLVTTNDGSTIRPGNLVFIYKRAASRFVDGVACHDLTTIEELKND